MRTILMISFGVFVCLAFAVSDASAQRRGGINDRQQDQRSRIVSGVRSGEGPIRKRPASHASRPGSVEWNIAFAARATDFPAANGIDFSGS